MGVEKSKEVLLNNHGYKYSPYRMIYFSIEQKKVFSYEYIEDNQIMFIEKNILDRSDQWEFYFNIPTSKDVKEQIISELKNTK